MPQINRKKGIVLCSLCCVPDTWDWKREKNTPHPMSQPYWNQNEEEILNRIASMVVASFNRKIRWTKHSLAFGDCVSIRWTIQFNYNVFFLLIFVTKWYINRVWMVLNTEMAFQCMKKRKKTIHKVPKELRSIEILELSSRKKAKVRE